MAQGAQQFRISRLLWGVVPGISIIFFMGLTLLPFGQVGGRFVTPALPLIPIYYWAIHRAEHIPPALIFASGLLLDFATAGPVGVWAVVFLIIYAITLWLGGELAGLPMRFAWVAFAGVALIGLVAGWFAHCLYNGGFVSLVPVILQALTTAVVFPVLIWPLVFVESEIAGAMRH